MVPIQSILVGLDLTPDCAAVWREACALARSLEAELHLVHAVTDLDPRSPELEHALSGAESRLLELRQAAIDQGARVAPAVFARAGDAGETIAQAARDLRVDLVVIGTGVRSASDRRALGFTAERVLRDVEAPVWIVRPARPHERVERIVAAVDAARPQREVIHAAGLIARPGRLGLTVLALYPEGARGADVLERVRAAVGGTAAESLDVEVYARATTAPPTDLVDVAERDCVDLLVLGEAPHPTPRRREEVVERLLRVAPCSILRVPLAPVAAPAGVA